MGSIGAVLINSVNEISFLASTCASNIDDIFLTRHPFVNSTRIFGSFIIKLSLQSSFRDLVAWSNVVFLSLLLSEICVISWESWQVPSRTNILSIRQIKDHHMVLSPWFCVWILPKRFWWSVPLASRSFMTLMIRNYYYWCLLHKF